jgi:glycosyltransferase involved in cell wall biosynthesis
VLHVVPALLSDDGRILGGAERYALELARHMGRRVPTRLLTFGAADDVRTIQGLPVRIVAGAHPIYGNRFNPIAGAIVPELLRSDVVHCHQGDVLVAKVAALVARASGRRAFATDHGGGAYDLTSHLPTDRLFHGHLHVSAFSRRRAGHEARPETEVVYGGVDTERFSPADAPGGPQRALFVGRIVPHKGVDDLIEGLPEGLGLDIAGAPLNQRFLGELHELARGKDVAFHHDWDDARLVDGYRRALAIVLPSVHRGRDGTQTEVPELLGQTLLEGMACGRPAICTDVTAMPEVVRPAVTGFIVPEHSPDAIGDRLSWLAAHPRDADELGRNARRDVIERFSWPAVVERCLRAYERAS